STSTHDPLDLLSFPTRRSSDLGTQNKRKWQDISAQSRKSHVSSKSLFLALIKCSTKRTMLPVSMVSPAEERNNRNMLFSLAKSKDRKSTRLNSSHVKISYAVFC